MADRTMKLVAFLQAQNCSNYPGSWRHRESSPGFLTADYYRRIAQILEEAKFHVAFFDDRLAMPDRYGDDFAESVRNGVRVVKLDLIPLLTVMGMSTRCLGLGGTYSTSYHEPFHVARVFATLDHMVGGRAAWNVVTSLNNSEAANFGAREHLDHDTRYDRADEFMEAVLGHWDSWADDAIVFDREADVFADPAKVRRIEHAGRWFRTRGPFTVPRTPQGRPVIMQAGQSGRGRRFAGRWGELLFVAQHSIPRAQEEYRLIKDEVAGAGRDPDLVSICPAIYTVVAETQAEAEARDEYVQSLARPIDALALLSEGLNFDFSTKGLDDPFTAEELDSISGLQALRDRVIRAAGKPNPTVRDFIELSGRGTVRDHPRFVGTPRQVVDQMEQWFAERACDGFVIAATHVPGAYEEFATMVVPELQRRGLFHRDYAGLTLRENLGLPVPSRA
ncbi:MAG: LLM class flavin-dependent oxidoreductase [Chloroflexota bacterium]